MQERALGHLPDEHVRVDIPLRTQGEVSQHAIDVPVGPARVIELHDIRIPSSFHEALRVVWEDRAIMAQGGRVPSADFFVHWENVEAFCQPRRRNGMGDIARIAEQEGADLRKETQEAEVAAVRFQLLLEELETARHAGASERAVLEMLLARVFPDARYARDQNAFIGYFGGEARGTANCEGRAKIVASALEALGYDPRTRVQLQWFGDHIRVVVRGDDGETYVMEGMTLQPWTMEAGTAVEPLENFKRRMVGLAPTRGALLLPEAERDYHIPENVHDVLRDVPRPVPAASYPFRGLRDYATARSAMPEIVALDALPTPLARMLTEALLQAERRGTTLRRIASRVAVPFFAALGVYSTAEGGAATQAHQQYERFKETVRALAEKLDDAMDNDEQAPEALQEKERRTDEQKKGSEDASDAVPSVRDASSGVRTVDGGEWLYELQARQALYFSTADYLLALHEPVTASSVTIKLPGATRTVDPKFWEFAMKEMQEDAERALVMSWMQKHPDTVLPSDLRRLAVLDPLLPKECTLDVVGTNVSLSGVLYSIEEAANRATPLHYPIDLHIRVNGEDVASYRVVTEGESEAHVNVAFHEKVEERYWAIAETNAAYTWRTPMEQVSQEELDVLKAEIKEKWDGDGGVLPSRQLEELQAAQRAKERALEAQSVAAFRAGEQTAHVSFSDVFDASIRGQQNE